MGTGSLNKKNDTGKAKGKVVHSAHHEGLFGEPPAWLHAFLNLEPVVIFFTLFDFRLLLQCK
jgi:hypothetical protein